MSGVAKDLKREATPEPLRKSLLNDEGRESHLKQQEEQYGKAHCIQEI